MAHTVTESIYNGSVIVPLADVQHIEKWDKNAVPGAMVITKHTWWNVETSAWANAIWISEPELTAFRRAWCRYRSELETNDLADLSPACSDLMALHDKTMAALTTAKGGEE